MWQALFYVNPVTTVASLAVFFALSIGICLLVPLVRTARRIAGVILLLAVMAYVYVLVQPTHGWSDVFQSSPSITLNPIDSFAYANLTDGLVWETTTLNTLLFVPLGIIACVAISNRIFLWTFGPALSLVIEISQALLGTGRQTDIVDLMTNSFGYFIGLAMMYTAMLLTRRSWSNPPKVASEQSLER